MASFGSRSAALGRTLRLPSRVLGLVLMFVFVALATAPPAGAGGATFAFDRAWYAPGDMATGRVAFELVNGLGTVADGPYAAYLLARPGTSLRPGRIPHSAIRLDTVSVARSRASSTQSIARIRFLVPDIASGSYVIEICNAGCETSLGDITFGRIEIFHTRYEAALAYRLERASQRVDAVRSELRRTAERAEALEARAQRAVVALRATARKLAASDARAEALERRLAAVTRPERPSEAAFDTAWPVVATLGAVVAALAVLASRRRDGVISGRGWVPSMFR